MNKEKESAEEAGLIYVNHQSRGFTRKAKGKSFQYFDDLGKRITDKKVIERINKLAIPPAYQNVWICPSPRGHIQATGRDARRRLQYRYHEKWREFRDAHKYDRMMNFSKVLPKIREVTDKHLSLTGLPREKVLATVVQLLEKTLIRVGNDEYAKSNQSFGLTTLRNKHVEIEGSEIHFEFLGKSKVHHAIDLRDRRLAKIIKNCQDLPGHELFQYVDSGGQRHRIASEDVNAYLQEITGDEYTAKDFRTWAGTLLAVTALKDVSEFESITQAKRQLNQAIEVVAEKLGNTKAICRKCYIHPAVLNAYMEKRLFKVKRLPKFEEASPRVFFNFLEALL